MKQYNWKKFPKAFLVMYEKVDKTDLDLILDLLKSSSASDSNIQYVLAGGVAKHPDATMKQIANLLIKIRFGGGNVRDELLARYGVFCLLGCDPKLNPIYLLDHNSTKSYVKLIKELFEDPSNS